MSNTKFSFLIILILSLCLAVFTFTGLSATANAAEGEPSTVTTEVELIEALAVGGNIKLGADIMATANYTILEGKTVVLDLNGFTLDMGSYSITNNGTLELCGETGGEVTGIFYKYVIENYGSFTLTSGTVSNTNSELFTDADNGFYGVESTVIYNDFDSEIVINGGTVNGAKKGIDNCGSLTINGGAVIGSSTAIINGDMLTVNGGEIQGGDGIENGGTVKITGGEIEVRSEGILNYMGNIEMTGGWINGSVGIYMSDGNASVSGGTLNGTYGIHIGYDGTATLSGGIICKFLIENNDLTIADCLAPGYLYYYYEDGSVITVAEGSKKMLFTFTVAPCQNHTGGTEDCDKTSVCTLCKGEYIHHPDENGDCICDFCLGFTFPGTGTELDPYVVTTDAELIAAIGGGDTVYIKLGADVTATTKNYFINAGTTVSIDLNGHTIDLGGKYFDIRTSAAFEICDSGSGGMVVGTGDKVIYNILGGRFTLTNATLRNDNSEPYNGSSVIYNSNSSEMLMNGGTVSGTSHGITIDYGSKATINGGTVSGIDFCGISNYASTLIVNGGDISSGSTGIENNGGNVTVNGGDISVYNANLTGGTTIYNYDSGTVTIGGDTQISSSNDFSNGIYNYNGTVNVLGATITASGENSYAICNVDTFSLSGGTIEGDIITTVGSVADLLKPGYLYYDESGNVVALTQGQTELSGTMIVDACENHTYTNGICSSCRYACTHDSVDKATGICQVCSKQSALSVKYGEEMAYFNNLADAIAKADEIYSQLGVESVIKLYDNLTVTDTVTMTGGDFTLDLNGKTITFNIITGETGLTLDGATLTVDDTSEDMLGSLYFTITGDPESIYYFTLKNSSLLTWHNGTLTGYGGFSFILLDGSSVVQNGGTINKNAYVDNGKYTLNDGSFVLPLHSHTNGSDEYPMEIVINGGTINGDPLISSSNPPRPISITITGGTFANRQLVLDTFYSPDEINLSGGTFEYGIQCYGNYLFDVLAEGYAFYDADGNLLIFEEQTQIDEKVTVGICTHKYVYSDWYDKITETCQNSACTHSATATVSAPTMDYIYYDGTAHYAIVTYSEGWGSGELTVTYTETANDGSDYALNGPINAGNPIATISIGEATAYTGYTINRSTPNIGEVNAVSPATIYTTTARDSILLDREDGTVPGTLTLDAEILMGGIREYNYIFTPTDTANYNEFSGTFNMAVVTDSIQSIVITTQPDKTTYIFGERFDTTGMVVTATRLSGLTFEYPLDKLEFKPTHFTVDTKEVTATFIAEGEKEWTLTQAITVNPKVVTNPTIRLDETSYRYTGQPILGVVWQVWDGDYGVEQSEYSVEITNNIDIGTATVTIVDNEGGNFIISGNTTFEIVEALFRDVSVSQSGTLSYTSKALTPAVTASATTVDGSEVTFTYSATQNGSYSEEVPTFVNAGTHTVYYKANAERHQEYSGSFEVVIKKGWITAELVPEFFTFTPPTNLDICDGLPKVATITPKNSSVGAVTAIMYHRKNTDVREEPPTTVDTWYVVFDFEEGDDLNGGEYCSNASFQFTFDIADEGPYECILHLKRQRHPRQDLHRLCKDVRGRCKLRIYRICSC